MRVLRSIVTFGLLVAAGAGAWMWTQRPRRAAPRAAPVAVATARPMDFDTTLLVTGTLEPANIYPIVVTEIPGQSSIIYAAPDGSRVKGGDVVIRLDTVEAEKRLNTLQDQMQQAKEKLNRAQVDGERQIENAKSSVAMAQERLRIAQAQNAADLERARAELDQAQREQEYADGLLAKKQRLFDQGLVTRQELDEESENARKQRFNREKSQRSLANTQREAAERERAAKEDLQKAELALTNAEIGKRRALQGAQNALNAIGRQVEEVRRQIQGATIRTGVPGVVLLSTTWRGPEGPRPLRVGDEAYQGRPMARVIDPQRVLVDCEIDETDINKIKAGQKVRLRVATAQEKSFSGAIKTIDSIASEPSWHSHHGGSPGKRAFTATVDLEGGDLRLKPGMTAWLEIIVDSVRGKIAVPLAAVFRDHGKPVVYRKEGAGFEEVTATLGPRSDLYWAILSGLKSGDLVAVGRPAAASVNATKAGQ